MDECGFAWSHLRGQVPTHYISFPRNSAGLALQKHQDVSRPLLPPESAVRAVSPRSRPGPSGRNSKDKLAGGNGGRTLPPDEDNDAEVIDLDGDESSDDEGPQLV